MSPQVLRLCSGLAAFMLFFQITSAEVVFETLRSFGNMELAGTRPGPPPTIGTDGTLYGVTQGGGRYNRGTVFRLNRNGDGYRVLYAFNLVPDAEFPSGRLVEASDGMLYGITRRGGLHGYGTAFRLGKDGRNYSVLWDFGLSPSSGWYPAAGLIEATDGLLYGTTSGGGAFGRGIIFSLGKNGEGLTVLRTFGMEGFDGASPDSPLVEAIDGYLYGTTPSDGSNIWPPTGVLFKIAKSGFDYRILHRFSSASGTGWQPQGVIEGTDGALYGTTTYGGGGVYGTVYRITRDGTDHTILYGFQAPEAGRFPEAPVIEGKDGFLYGTTELGGGTNAAGALFRIEKNGSNYTVLRSFRWDYNDGLYPESAPVMWNDGRLYGTTPEGGQRGSGTLYSLSTDGQGYTNLHHFSEGGGDGVSPIAGLLEIGGQGLIGSTASGGDYGDGTLFRMNQDGTDYAILHQFEGDRKGGTPSGRLLLGSDGAFYGTTQSGGSNFSGTIFRMGADGGGYTNLHHFAFRGADGQGWLSGVMEGTDGRLYGTTPDSTTNFCGTIFRVNKDGSGFEQLLVQTNNRPNEVPSHASPALIECVDGMLYGNASFGGQAGFGTVFRLNKDGSDYEVLYDFNGTNSNDGARPRAMLLKGSDNALYGTTERGGLEDKGTVFKMDRDGSTYTILHHFLNSDGAAFPDTELIETGDGWLYGRTRVEPSTNSVLYRLKRDGSAFTVLRGMPGTPSRARTAQGTLLYALDGAFYGVDVGESHLGSVFRVRLIFELSISSTPEGPNLRFGGLPGIVYDLERATHLEGPWEAIMTRQAPLENLISHTDTNPVSSAGFYRAKRASGQAR